MCSEMQLKELNDRILYAGQEATVKEPDMEHRLVPNWKRVRQGRIFSPCLFNLYEEYIMQNAGLDEAQAGIKMAGRNINNLGYADNRKRRRTKDPLDESERGK